MSVAILTAPTITSLPPDSSGTVVVSGSHGGLYPGYCTAKGKLRAVILNDAGGGKDNAGVASLSYLQALGIAAATVSHLSCRIGDPPDMISRGVISHANAGALACGVKIGMPCAEAAQALTAAPLREVTPPDLGETRSEEPARGQRRRILLLDSAAMVRPEDAGHIIVTGSHGGLVGGVPAMALRVDGFAGVYHDAGIGIDDAGITRLPALDTRGIAGITVTASSARIGDARSVYADGVISRVNETARSLGAREGERVADVLQAWTL